MVVDRRSLSRVRQRAEWCEPRVILSMLVVLAVFVVEAIHSGQPAWVLIGLIGPAVLAVAVIRDWPRRVRR